MCRERAQATAICQQKKKRITNQMYHKFKSLKKKKKEREKSIVVVGIPQIPHLTLSLVLQDPKKNSKLSWFTSLNSYT